MPSTVTSKYGDTCQTTEILANAPLTYCKIGNHFALSIGVHDSVWPHALSHPLEPEAEYQTPAHSDDRTRAGFLNFPLKA